MTNNVLNTQPIFNFVPASTVRWTSNVIPSYYQIQLRRDSGSRELEGSDGAAE